MFNYTRKGDTGIIIRLTYTTFNENVVIVHYYLRYLSLFFPISSVGELKSEDILKT